MSGERLSMCLNDNNNIVKKRVFYKNVKPNAFHRANDNMMFNSCLSYSCRRVNIAGTKKINIIKKCQLH